MLSSEIYYQRRTPTGWIDDSPVTLSTLLILRAAEDVGITWRILPGSKIIELSKGDRIKHFRYQISPETNDIGFYSCENKSVTSDLLNKAGISVPKGFGLTADDPEEVWLNIFRSLQKPLVVKPTNANKGTGITTNIRDEQSYVTAVKRALGISLAKDAGAIIEETFVGKEYRILATREKVLGIAHRIPANVTGDGTSTIEHLISVRNQEANRGNDDTYFLSTIVIDDDLKQVLANQKLDLQTVLPAGTQVFLRTVSNISKGGDSLDMTNLAHPSVKEIALQAMQAIPGLAFGGIDFMTPDITQPQTPDSYVIIEINSSPGICIHEIPQLHTPKFSQYEFLKLSFPEIEIPTHNVG